MEKIKSQVMRLLKDSTGYTKETMNKIYFDYGQNFYYEDESSIEVKFDLSKILPGVNLIDLEIEYVDCIVGDCESERYEISGKLLCNVLEIRYFKSFGRVVVEIKLEEGFKFLI